jgi:hypothetical protein
MTRDDFGAALKEALEPVTTSVREMSGKFEKFQLTTTSQLAEIRTDMKHLRRGHADLAGSVERIRDDHAECIARTNWPLIEAHLKREDDSQVVETMKSAMSRPTDKQSNGNIKVSIPRAAVKYVPWLIVAALLGAALVGGLIFGKASGREEGVQEATQYFTRMPAVVQQDATDEEGVP